MHEAVLFLLDQIADLNPGVSWHALELKQAIQAERDGIVARMKDSLRLSDIGATLSSEPTPPAEPK